MARTVFSLILSLLFLIPLNVSAETRKYYMSDMGLKPGLKRDLTLELKTALDFIRSEVNPGDKVVMTFEKGTYNFHAEKMDNYEVYISNHDQHKQRKVAFWFDGFENLTFDGGGANFVFHGRLVPFVLINSRNCEFKDFSIDFAQPQIAQVEIVKNNGEGGIDFRPAPWVDGFITPDGRFAHRGEGWEETPTTGIAFERKTRRIVYNTADLIVNTAGVTKDEQNVWHAPRWIDDRLVDGTVVALRSYGRPCPGIVLAESVNTHLKKINVHYAEGMGLVAQRCTNIELDKFNVCLRGNSDKRYFTTQADATHFSQCRGVIMSEGGLYEGMMDDAINVHGIYLEVKERIDNRTLRCSYSHGQTWGFAWGNSGDIISIVRSATMDELPFRTAIAAIRDAAKPAAATSPADFLGTREFVITFTDDLPEEIGRGERYGIENLTWTPEVYFARNLIRNNRARGALFSSPRYTLCEQNVFDHTSGAAIVLCGDCNGWYESGAVRDLVIRDNEFIDALTSLYQFTNAVISIYPEIPKFGEQKGYFHGAEKNSILIENNLFKTFDAPLLYAKSVRGLTYRNNRVKQTYEYAPFHPNIERVKLERCIDTFVDKFE